jgi:ubiquinone biosynthesis monooxygenase Coq7
MSLINAMIEDCDKALRTILGASPAVRANPAAGMEDAQLTEEQRRHSAGLMRVNHVGEICAQALYQSQSRNAARDDIARQFVAAGKEEQDHLTWTAERLKELGSRQSVLNPLWYAGSYLLGAVAGRMGDATSLAFMVETEKQVEAHLAKHLEQLPREDNKSRAIVDQMRADEASHGRHAQELGAGKLPEAVRRGMTVMAKIMTTTAYYL